MRRIAILCVLAAAIPAAGQRGRVGGGMVFRGGGGGFRHSGTGVRVGVGVGFGRVVHRPVFVGAPLFWGSPFISSFGYYGGYGGYGGDGGFDYRQPSQPTVIVIQQPPAAPSTVTYVTPPPAPAQPPPKQEPILLIFKDRSVAAVTGYRLEGNRIYYTNRDGSESAADLSFLDLDLTRKANRELGILLKLD